MLTDFQQFKDTIEMQLLFAKVGFELQEFHYQPYAFGNGLLVYKIRGCNFKLEFDGREKLMIISKSNFHEKYNQCNWLPILTIKSPSEKSIIELILLFRNTNI
jgi:hypothetical protein